MIQDSSEEDIFHLCTRYHTLRLRNDIHVEEKESNQAVCVSVYTGYGPKSRHARMQPLTRGPEDDETKTMTVARPHHVCVPLSERRQHRPARSTLSGCPHSAYAPRKSAPTCVGKSRNMSADMLFRPGLLA